MDLLIKYLQERLLLKDKAEARRIKNLSTCYVMLKGKNYKQSFSWPLLHHLRPSKAEYALHEVHKNIYDNYLEGRALAHKVLQQEYY